LEWALCALKLGLGLWLGGAARRLLALLWLPVTDTGAFALALACALPLLYAVLALSIGANAMAL